MIVGIDARYGLRRNRRGIGNYIYHLLCEFRKLSAKDIRFVLYVDKAADPDVVKLFKDSSFLIRVLPALNPIIWEQVTLYLAARQDKIDLLHCTSNVAPIFLKSCPIVTTLHDVIEFHRQEFDSVRPTLRKQGLIVYQNIVLPVTARRSSRIITVSEFSRGDISSTLRINKGKIKVVYEGPSLIPLTQKDESNVIYSADIVSNVINRDFIFALGAVDSRKNTVRLIEAYRRLQEQSAYGIQMVIIGIERPEEFASLAGNGVSIYAFLPEEIVRALYRNCLFFVYPSLYEGFGLPVLDAMTFGAPVACSGTTAVGEIAGEAALKFNPQDVGDIAQKMQVLIENSDLRAELSKKGRIRAKEFSWGRCALETLSVYREVLGD